MAERFTIRYGDNYYCKIKDSDCHRYNKDNDVCCCGCEIAKKMIDKLGKYEDMEEQGKLVILPCKPGYTVYVIKKIIMYGEVGDNSSFEYIIDTDKFDYWMIPLIGKTVFLTEQEALKALEGMKE